VRLGNQALRIVMFVSIPAAVGIALVAGDMFSVLGYSADYRNAIPLVQILSTGLPVIAVDVILGALLIAVDRQRQWLVVGCVALVLNPLLNSVAIPWTQRHYGNGAVGASVVTVTTEIVMLLGALRLRPAGILDERTAAYSMRCLLAAAAMVPVVVLLGDEPLAVEIVAGIAVYAAASIAMRTLRPRRWRDDFLPRHEAVESLDADLAIAAAR
jgi:O-antigen/teichoic acid export membrane protein